ncbi:hypothetical protein [Siphonobacter sp. SORGH_AS_0500]|uniref:hypothetical protein n=1 Tax=Siphonobacter sp. SORGH_AS_0500 TaxID=1864824 RepID=UPI002861655A|nr:hypothetical protein [Siphonobacter sp. SORGH_AS_0500]MDR6194721.1 hypothetical protein [Siphonobacter sp. SORGH_AS_0500]
MKKIYFFTTFIIAWFTASCIGYSQTIKFENRQVTYIVSEEKDITNYIKLKISDIKIDTDVKIKKNNLLKSVYDFNDVNITIKPGVSGFEIPFTVNKSQAKEDSIELILDSQGILDHMKIIFTKKENIVNDKVKKLSNIRILMGHSFDFLEDNKTKNAVISYFKIDAFIPKLLDSKQGVHFYLYQNNFNTSKSDSLGQGNRISDIYRVPGQGLNFNDSAKYVRGIYNRVTQQNNKVFGFGLSYLKCLGENNLMGNTKYFLNLGFEYVKRTYDLNYNYELVDSDTIRGIYNPIRPSITTLTKRVVINNELYGGIGFTIDNTNEIADFRIKYQLGYLISTNSSPDRGMIILPKVGISNWFNVELTERKSTLDLTLGVDFRQNTNSGYLYNVYLSKTFNIEKLKDLVKN